MLVVYSSTSCIYALPLFFPPGSQSNKRERGWKKAFLSWWRLELTTSVHVDHAALLTSVTAVSIALYQSGWLCHLCQLYFGYNLKLWVWWVNFIYWVCSVNKQALRAGGYAHAAAVTGFISRFYSANMFRQWKWRYVGCWGSECVRQPPHRLQRDWRKWLHSHLHSSHVHTEAAWSLRSDLICASSRLSNTADLTVYHNFNL